MRRRREPRRTLLLAVVAALTALVVGAVGGERAAGVGTAPTVRWQGLVGGARPRVTTGQRMIVVLRAPSLADRVAAAGGRVGDLQERAWTRTALNDQKVVIYRLGIQGVSVRPDYTFARVINGFSAVLDARAVSLLERAPDVAGVYPVRTAYPAASLVSRAFDRSDIQRRAAIGLTGFDGRGVTIALLDTGVDRTQPFVRGRIADGIDVVGGDPLALAAAKPDGTAELERHGTQMAGILVGDGGPDGLRGVAPGATVLPVRVAGWQRDAEGGWGVYARTDQIVAGLERAVDPNDDGDAHDAARVALIPLAEPYAAFAEGPAARAAAGAAALDTLVVAPAGNDGPAGPSFGSISGPGGAPAALTVGAVDQRAQTDEVRVVVRVGLQVVLDRVVPLAGSVAPGRSLSLQVTTVPRESSLPALPLQPAASSQLARFFDAKGYSRVAGRAALLPAGADPQSTVQAAARAGAEAVILYGERLPAGAFGFDESANVPVVGLPPNAARILLAAVTSGASAGVSIGAARRAANDSVDHVAPFSSGGLAFDGRVKPELVAPGVGEATSDAISDGGVSYGTVNGTSAAAAIVAGSAAILAQARPGLDATDLKSVLVENASPIPDDAVTVQGTGLVDVGAAAAAEISTEPTSLALGRAPRSGWTREQTLILHNLSTRPVRLRIEDERQTEGAAAVSLTPRPRTLTLLRGQSGKVRLRFAVASEPVGNAAAQGTIVVQPVGGMPLRVPWAIAFGRTPRNLIGIERLSKRVFSPSDSGPALLFVRTGRILAGGTGQQIVPLARLDIELWTSEGRDMGLLARVRDVLPGRYAFGLTGRDPFGHLLARGEYELRLAAYPTLPGRVTRRTIRFTIK
jgi:subtilisin family serine protease